MTTTDIKVYVNSPPEMVAKMALNLWHNNRQHIATLGGIRHNKNYILWDRDIAMHDEIATNMGLPIEHMYYGAVWPDDIVRFYVKITHKLKVINRPDGKKRMISPDPDIKAVDKSGMLDDDISEEILSTDIYRKY
jgi:hypothetical protein